MKVNPTLVWIASTIAACSAIATAWIQIGGPIPASQLYVTQSGDNIKKEMTRGFRRVERSEKEHSKESAKWGRKIYTKELHDLLVLPTPTEPEQKQYWRENIEDAKRKQKYYEDLEIELRKK